MVNSLSKLRRDGFKIKKKIPAMMQAGIFSRSLPHA